MSVCVYGYMVVCVYLLYGRIKAQGDLEPGRDTYEYVTVL